MAIEVSLTKLSDDPQSRACVICGSAKMTHSYQLGQSSYSIEIDDVCLAKIITQVTVEKEPVMPPKVGSTKPKKEFRGGLK